MPRGKVKAPASVGPGSLHAGFRVAAQVKRHAIDESRHAKAYVAMLDFTFPEIADNDFRAQLASLSPGYNREAGSRPLRALRTRARSPWTI